DAEKREMAGWVHGMRLTTAGWIRKEPCNFGWDWGPKLPTSGIWRNISLLGVEQARIDDVRVQQVHHEKYVEVTVSLSVSPRQKETVTAVVSLALEGMTIM